MKLTQKLITIMHDGGKQISYTRPAVCRTVHSLHLSGNEGINNRLSMSALWGWQVRSAVTASILRPEDVNITLYRNTASRPTRTRDQQVDVKRSLRPRVRDVSGGTNRAPHCLRTDPEHGVRAKHFMTEGPSGSGNGKCLRGAGTASRPAETRKLANY